MPILKKISNQSSNLHLNALEKEQTKSKASRRKEIVKIGAKINEIKKIPIVGSCKR